MSHHPMAPHEPIPVDSMPHDPAAALQRLLAVMARLRDPDKGCAWDVAQTFATIAPYTIEEAYEVADACEAGDLQALRDELGDLLLQVVFHARIAEEAGAFRFKDVVEAIEGKMIRRHPHIFGDAPRAAGHTAWEAIKAEERGSRSGALDGIARALPALMRAEKLQKRAARTGFDWPDAAGARLKLLEELHEVDTATNDAHRAEEIGDLLFAAVNLARKHDVPAEDALRAANAKFERRFRAMEALAGARFADLSPAEQEALWDQVKRARPTD